ncbi:hypothetical protein [Streptomyces sp. NK08204]|nr:hypothetical protein [Streptomyces sp. NK08204]
MDHDITQAPAAWQVADTVPARLAVAGEGRDDIALASATAGVAS